VKRYAGLRAAIRSAVETYAGEVRRRSFPEPAQVYRLDPGNPKKPA
jgi:ketopantoate hydroxymethyltransferase